MVTTPTCGCFCYTSAMEKPGTVIYTDGASRSNPGLAGAGAVIFHNGTPVAEVRSFLGTQTNNWAEYEAVAIGLAKAKELGYHKEAIAVYMDSTLVAEQLSGNWKVKKDTLKIQHEKITNLLKDFARVTFSYIPRDENAYADRLANEAIDHA